MDTAISQALSVLSELQGAIPWWVGTILVVFVLLAFPAAFFISSAVSAEADADRAGMAALAVFRRKLGKVPALTMALRDYLSLPDEVLRPLEEAYARNVLRNFADPYSLAEANGDVSHEISFVMRAANRHHKVNLDARFLYLRDFIVRYESELAAAFREVGAAVARRNRLVRLKNRTLVGLPFPPHSQLPDMVDETSQNA